MGANWDAAWETEEERLWEPRAQTPGKEERKGSWLGKGGGVKQGRCASPPLGSPLRVPDTLQMRDRRPLRCLLPACLVYQPVSLLSTSPVFGLLEAGRGASAAGSGEEEAMGGCNVTPSTQRLGLHSHLVFTSLISTWD